MKLSEFQFSMYRYIFACAYESQVNIRCLFQSFSTVLLRQGLSLNPERHDLSNQVTSKLRGSSGLHPSTQPPPRVQEPKPRSSCQHSKHLTNGAITPAFTIIKLLKCMISMQDHLFFPFIKLSRQLHTFENMYKLTGVFADSCVLLVQGVFSGCKLNLVINSISFHKENIPCETGFRPACYGAVQFHILFLPNCVRTRFNDKLRSMQQMVFIQLSVICLGVF